MTCDSIAKLIPLYYYGELLPDDEERVEDHTHACEDCARELDRQRAIGSALNRRQMDVSPGLLADCRRDLLVAVYRGEAQAAAAAGRRAGKTPWKPFQEAMAATFTGLARYRQPIGAVALVALGFFAARFTGPAPPSFPVTVSPVSSDRIFSTVRSVQPDASGRVQIAFDETRRRVISGNMQDENIRRLLLAAARDENNAAVRVESVGLMRAAAASGDIRTALINAVEHDLNAGVRLKALEGLKPLAGDPQVRSILAQVLLADDNPAVRMQVIDLLVEHRDVSMVGVLQNVVQKDDNSYVRLKCEKALKEMNASIGTF